MMRWSLILIIVISLLLPAIWLREGLTIACSETGFLFLINPLRFLNINKYIWWDSFGLGYDNARALPSVLYHIMMSGLQFLGFSAVLRQYLVYSTTLLLSSLSMYFLIIELMQRGNGKKSKIVALIGSLFYILNPFTMNYIWHRFTTSMYGMPLMPLIFLITIKLIKSPSFKYAFLFAITVLFFSVNAINPGYFLPLFFPAILYAAFKIFQEKRHKQWKYIGTAGLLTIGLNFWWILPLYLNRQVEYDRIAASNFFDMLKSISVMTPLLYVLRLMETTYIKWYAINYHPGWIEFLIPILAGIAILFATKRNRDVLFFAFLFIAGLFLSKGLQPPGGSIFKWMFQYIPFFGAFRIPIEKFGLIVVFSYSILVPIGIYKIWELIKNSIIKTVTTAVILVLLFAVSIWPMWTGDLFSFYQKIIPEEVKDIPTVRVKIPDYWEKAANYINRDREAYRIVFLPQSPFDGMWYKWEYGYAGADFGSVNLLFDKPVIAQPITGNPYAGNYLKTVFNSFFLKDQATALRFLSLMNVRYILVRNDVDEIAIHSIPLGKIHELLNSFKSIDKVSSFGKLDLYKISDKYFIPRIYISSAPGFVNSDVESPGLTFKRVNPTKYLVKIDKAKRPFWLIFSESFNEKWKLYELKAQGSKIKARHITAFTPQDLKLLFQRPVDATHRLVNGYANGWYIDPKDVSLGEEFTLVLYFWPQNLFYLGLIISGTTLIGCICYLIQRKSKRKEICYGYSSI